MFGAKLKSALLTVAAALSIGVAAPANAGVINGWNLNLSLLNGVNSTVFAQNATNIDQIQISGNSVVQQSLLGGSPVNQPFVDNGFLQLTGYDKVGVLGFNGIQAGFNSISGNPNVVFFNFSNLTGIFNSNGSITFNPSAGVTLYAEDNNLFNLTGHVTTLATFNLIAPSGGSNLDFFGGANPTGTINVTLVETSGIAGLYTDSGNNILPPLITLHLGNVNALVNPHIHPNPAFSPAGPGCINNAIVPFGGPPNGGPDCTLATLNANNSGQYNVAIPEPGTLALLGFGLLAAGYVTRRRKAA